MTWCNPYSHVVIYVGQTEGVHEVVHATKANLHGCVMGKIVKEDIFAVIKPDEQVFLGHKVESCQFAANLRERIAKRANACVDPDLPTIVFDYDHRWFDSICPKYLLKSGPTVKPSAI